MNAPDTTLQLRQQLYLIFKEAVNNIVKHSRATEVSIGYRHGDGGFRLSIVNNGYSEKERVSTRGQGLRNMDMRAARVKASVTAEARGDLFAVVVRGK